MSTKRLTQSQLEKLRKVQVNAFNYDFQARLTTGEHSLTTTMLPDPNHENAFMCASVYFSSHYCHTRQRTVKEIKYNVSRYTKERENLYVSHGLGMFGILNNDFKEQKTVNQLCAHAASLTEDKLWEVYNDHYYQLTNGRIV